MKQKGKYTLLTFFKFVDIKNPEQQVADHLKFTTDIGMKGRIYIGKEGISATLTGNAGQVQAYKMYLAQNPYFNDIKDIDVKATPVDDYYFDRMIVKYRDEIVALGETVTQQEVNQFVQNMSIDEFKKIIDSGNEDYTILDMRNTYEYKLGHFKGALPAGTVNFREMKDLLVKYKEKFAGKKVIMYCTGGIRCDKLSVLLKKHGINEFYGLEGGVVNYTNTYDDGNWLGSLYTFDGRVSTFIGSSTTHTTIGKCIYSDLSTNTCENCRYSDCNARIICRTKHYKKHMGFCSQACYEDAKKTLQIKDIAWDELNYQVLRNEIRNHPEKKEEILKTVADHLDSHLKDVVFRHATSQKEELVDHELMFK